MVLYYFSWVCSEGLTDWSALVCRKVWIVTACEILLVCCWLTILTYSSFWKHFQNWKLCGAHKTSLHSSNQNTSSFACHCNECLHLNRHHTCHTKGDYPFVTLDKSCFSKDVHSNSPLSGVCIQLASSSSGEFALRSCVFLSSISAVDVGVDLARSFLGYASSGAPLEIQSAAAWIRSTTNASVKMWIIYTGLSKPGT